MRKIEPWEKIARQFLKDLEEKTLSDMFGQPAEKPAPKLSQFNPTPLLDALESDGLTVDNTYEQGHGTSETIPYLRHKENSYFHLSKDEYGLLVQLAKIGLHSVGRERAIREAKRNNKE